jgi:hypothetical protein
MHRDLYFSPDAWGDIIKEDVIIWVHDTYGRITEMQYTKVYWENGKYKEQLDDLEVDR